MLLINIKTKWTIIFLPTLFCTNIQAARNLTRRMRSKISNPNKKSRIENPKETTKNLIVPRCRTHPKLRMSRYTFHKTGNECWTRIIHAKYIVGSMEETEVERMYWEQPINVWPSAFRVPKGKVTRTILADRTRLLTTPRGYAPPPSFFLSFVAFRVTSTF